ncbi:tRNA glutamyl-Q(34) synthetase GluQRS [Thalassotalea ponticola]|uniref:tRNA glutamyl-Q(34) synthetase GluQRS n=1 Tax=Thalassotalea ponticola TaxID=1523392 RepID=UPI0025B4F01B|nr:tRNA glutamyl-Q(34) synthetase GluQRS [Thalassotalea ponticola]MDN3653469.1 tRNA glutamyl-Q(34) synthetase GluQRS [Thalassotalea ponticola]
MFKHDFFGNKSERSHVQYRGRFAPSPSGHLHFGSLIAALGSYLQAKHQRGKWLVRIEDIDKPREQLGADKSILSTLEAYGLYWDEQVLYQSQQSDLYDAVIAELLNQRMSYYCQCTRAQIKAIGGIYQGHCKHLNLSPDGSALRLINHHPIGQFSDKVQGEVLVNAALSGEDFIIHRRDGLYAYQLAVVIDDIYQGITEVVRGCDLLEPTARQITLYKTLAQPQPDYAHLPLAVTEQGYKLSKQNAAPAIDKTHPQPALISALTFLGQQPDPALVDASVEQIIGWAIDHWQLDKVPQRREISL